MRMLRQTTRRATSARSVRASRRGDPAGERIERAVIGASLVVALAVLTAAPIAAQGWIEPGPRPWRGEGVVKLRTRVDVDVTDRVARVEVEEWFENRGGAVAEGDYLYPLPGEAVFSGFSLYQGDRELRGETMDADEARRIYESIVRRRKDPALIELAGHGLLRARVFPIEPGQTRRITLRYTQVLERAGDALAFRYAAGGRFGRRPAAEVGGGRTPDVIRGADGRPVPTGVAAAPIDFTLTVEAGDRFHDPFSPTHELEIDRDDGRLEVRPDDDLRGDFAVFLPLARGRVGMTLVTHRPATEDGYFMLTLSPGEADGPAVPRDVTVVLDVSGSMSGAKIDDAKRALRQLLGTLASRDRFRLIAFSNRVNAFERGWTRATRERLRDARRWVDDLRAGGGTAIADALAEAFEAESTDERLPIVVFLTDGLPSVGERNPERIAEQAERSRGRARVFAFGVGYDVNTYLLDRLTEAGRGATEYLEPGEEVETALGTLAAKVRHPVLTDLEIAGAPVEIEEVYPGTLPDLFAGEELVVLGRWTETDDDRSGELRVEGRRAGRAERFAVEASFPAREPGNDYLPRLWASRKVGALMREIRLHGRNEELVEEVRRLALRYGVITEYTAHLVREPLARLAGGAGGRGLPFARPDAGADITISPTTVQSRPITGLPAVKAAESARRQRAASSAADVAAMTATAEAAIERAVANTGVDARTVASRLFVREDGVWTDANMDETLRVVDVKPFGAAYFELLRRLPELVPIVRELDAVVVAGERVAIRMTDAGEERLAPAALDRIVREFRGS